VPRAIYFDCDSSEQAVDVLPLGVKDLVRFNPLSNLINIAQLPQVTEDLKANDAKFVVNSLYGAEDFSS